MECTHFPSWRFDAVCHALSRLARDGEVPRIRYVRRLRMPVERDLASDSCFTIASTIFMSSS